MRSMTLTRLNTSLPANKGSQTWLVKKVAAACFLAVCSVGLPVFGQGGPGTVAHWGDNSLAQAKPPANLGQVLMVSASSTFSLGLRTNKTVVAWGTDMLGETLVPPGLSDVKQVAAGLNHAAALKEDGTVVVWGDNSFGQLNVPAGLSGVTVIASGFNHLLALKNDGTVVAWGGNGQTEVMVPSGLSDVVAIAAGSRHSVALKADGTVVAWGDNLEGETSVPTGLSGVTAIAAGAFHTMALKNDGTIELWGDNREGQLNKPPGLNNVIAISAGWNFSLALKADRKVIGWGESDFGQQNPPASLIDVVAISAGNKHALAVVGPPPGPRIEMTGNGVVIARGDTTPALADHTLFGSTNIFGGAIERTFTIKNVGDEPLNLTGTPLVDLLGAQAAPFAVTALPDASIAPGDSSAFTIRFEPTAAGTRTATVSIASNDPRQNPFRFAIRGTGIIPPGTPTVRVDAPAASTRRISSLPAYEVRGLARDNDAIDRVEVELNGDPPINATLLPTPNPRSVPFTAMLNLVEGPNTLRVTAFDVDGNRSVTVVRNFEFERRYVLTVNRTVPPAFAAVPDQAGRVNLAARPAAGASRLAPAAVTPQTSLIVPGVQVRLTAVARRGLVFSHWTGLPAGSVVSGNVAAFAMPAQDEPNVTAVFVDNPFLPLATGNVYRGNLLPDGATTPGNDTVGGITATLTFATGAASGRLLMNGQAVAFRCLLLGDGSVWFSTRAGLVNALNFGPRSMTMNWDAAGLHVEVEGPGGAVSEGTARPAIYKNTAGFHAPAAFLNRNNGRSGVFTLTFPAKAQPVPKPLSEYAQGTSFGTITMNRNGTLRLALNLADGSTAAVSSALVAGDECPVFCQLPTPGARTRGGSFLGTLVFDVTQADTDVSGADFWWFRPAVTETRNAATRRYTDGWPGGIFVDAFGALYDNTLPMQAGLALPAVDLTNGNARLIFQNGKLVAPTLQVTNFNVVGSRVTKIPVNDRSFNLVLTQSSGRLRGTFTPDWTDPARSLPAFQGIVLQKGALKGGYGFFISNRLNDNDPESGSVLLTVP